MINYILLVYVVSTIILWIMFWLMMRQFKTELFTYYDVPETEDIKTSDISISHAVMFERVLVVVSLLIPVVNFLLVISYLVGDHLAILDDLALSYGAEPKEEYK